MSAARQSWISNFSRRTNSQTFIAEIDGLRCVAIGIVVASHVGAFATAVFFGSQPSNAWTIHLPGRMPELPAAISHLFAGYYGVVLFFVLSGFILGVPFASSRLLQGQPVLLKPYFMRRLTRLEPPYLLALAAFFILYSIFEIGSPHERQSGLMFGMPYAANLRGGNPLLTQAWSLEIEVQFYLLMPILSMLFAIRGHIRRRASIVAVMLIAAGLQSTVLPRLLERSIFNYLQYFLAGFLLVDLYLINWRGTRPAIRRWRWDAVWVLAWAAIGVLTIDRFQFNERFVLPMLLVLICVASFKGRVVNRLVTNRYVFTVGGMCYSIYLLHYGLLILLTRAVKSWTGGNYLTMLAVSFAVLLPLILIASGLFFISVERPCMDRRWPTRLTMWVSQTWSGPRD